MPSILSTYRLRFVYSKTSLAFFTILLMSIPNCIHSRPMDVITLVRGGTELGEAAKAGGAVAEGGHFGAIGKTGATAHDVLDTKSSPILPAKDPSTSKPLPPLKTLLNDHPEPIPTKLKELNQDHHVTPPELAPNPNGEIATHPINVLEEPKIKSSSSNSRWNLKNLLRKGGNPASTGKLPKNGELEVKDSITTQESTENVVKLKQETPVQDPAPQPVKTGNEGLVHPVKTGDEGSVHPVKTGDEGSVHPTDKIPHPEGGDPYLLPQEAEYMTEVDTALNSGKKPIPRTQRIMNKATASFNRLMSFLRWPFTQLGRQLNTWRETRKALQIPKWMDRIDIRAQDKLARVADQTTKAKLAELAKPKTPAGHTTTAEHTTKAEHTTTAETSAEHTTPKHTTTVEQLNTA